MGFLSRAIEKKSSDPVSLWREIMYGGSASKAGPNVTLESALKVSTAFACLKVLSQGCAQVPFKLFRETEVSGLTKILPAREHALYDKLTVQPNAWTTSFEFRETIVLHAALGDAYVFLNRVFGGKIAEFIILDPSKCRMEQKDDYSITYKVRGKSGDEQEFPAESIWHVRGPSWTGLGGMQILSMAREALGLSISTEETQSKLHSKGVRPSGTYSIDGNLNPQQYKDLKAWIDKEFAGAENSGAPMILDRGAKWFSQTMSGIDAQHLETRKHQVEEVCRFFGVSPLMVFSSDKTSTFASAEAFFDAHVKHTLSPWYARIEQSADAYLLTPKERAQGLYFKFIASGLLRGSSKDRSEYYAKALGSGGSQGWMTADEVRALEELNPMGGKAAELPEPTNAPKPAPITP